MAMETVMKVTFIRHAEGEHQLDKSKMMLVDPELTEKGVAQVAELKEYADAVSPDVILASPVMRAMQTATAFLDKSCEGETVPIIVTERVMEGRNIHACNHRRSRSELEARFPSGFDFSDVKDDVDPCPHDEYRQSLVEEIAVVRKRASAFLEWLTTEHSGAKHVVVFTHSGFLRCCFAVMMGLQPWYSPPSVMNAVPLTVEYRSSVGRWVIPKGLLSGAPVYVEEPAGRAPTPPPSTGAGADAAK